jgi:hypothetical protein
VKGGGADTAACGLAGWLHEFAAHTKRPMVTITPRVAAVLSVALADDFLPQFGHAIASLDISFPHSLQFSRAMIVLPHNQFSITIPA